METIKNRVSSYWSQRAEDFAKLRVRELESGSGHTPRLMAEPKREQVSLAALGEAEVVDRLRRTQPETLTPLEAMSLLYELKQKLN